MEDHPDRLLWLNRAVFLFASAVVLALILGMVSIVLIVRFSQENRTANLVNCRLLTNAIIESGAGGVAAKASNPQQQLTNLYIKVINRSMTPPEKRRQIELTKQIQIQGGTVTVPNCRDVANHPDSVKNVVPIPKESQ